MHEPPGPIADKRIGPHPRWSTGRGLVRVLLAASAALLCLPTLAADAPDSEFKKSALTLFDPAPVVVWNRTITELRVGLGGETAEARAVRIANRIADQPYDKLGDPITLAKASAGELNGVQVVLGHENLFTLIEEDLPGDGTSLDTYANAASENLKALFAARIEEQRPEVLLKGTALTVIATLVFVALTIFILRARDRLSQAAGRYIRERGVKVLEVDVRPLLVALGTATTNLIVFVIVVVSAYVFVSFVLSLFPYSAPVADSLGHWLTSALANLANGAFEALPGLLTVLLIFFITRLVTRGVGTIFRGVESGVIRVGWLAPDTARTTRQIVSSVIWLFGLTVAYPYIPGSSTDAFKGVSVLVGLMLSLGSAGLINQIMSGLVIVYSRALRVGDVVHVGDTHGTVQQIGLLSIKLKTAKEELVTIPNAVVVGNRVTNFASLDGETDAQIATSVTIGYDTPWRQVHALLVDAAGRTEGIRKTPEPFVVQRGLSDFYVEYELRAKISRASARFRVLSDLHAAVQDAFNEAGVQIMSPHFIAQPEAKVFVPPDAWQPEAAKHGL